MLCRRSAMVHEPAAIPVEAVHCPRPGWRVAARPARPWSSWQQNTAWHGESWGCMVLARSTGGSVSRALGAAAVADAAVLGLHYIAAAALLALGYPYGTLAAATALVSAGLWLAPALVPRLGGAVRCRVAMRSWDTGAAAGASAAAAVGALLLLTGGARWLGFPAAPWPTVAEATLLAAALGIAEEAFLRGTAFAVLEQRAGTLPAIWGAAVLLAAVRLLTGMGPITALTTIALGVWWGIVRARRGDAKFSAAAHAAWNAILGPVLGLGGEVAGGAGRSLLLVHLGPSWWAGPPGAVEGGLAALLVAAAAAIWAQCTGRSSPTGGGAAAGGD